ncbi:uncharacterized protein [Drosophila pseudoobscura]|uniref:Uncharacterized protein n=1 Tax=Drosophila pseudoobscura pseudoobscura TaxID=46245 RepID=B5DNM8_DROPS|nr:uncharacterized protein LOC6901016 [Drosophila pseudoobscura]
MLNSSEMKRTKEHVKRCREYQRSLREQIDELDHLMDDDFFKNPRRCWALLQKEHQEQYSQNGVPAVHSRKLLLHEGGLETSHGRSQKLTGTIWRLLHPDRPSRENGSRAASPVVKLRRELPSKGSDPLSALTPRPSPFHPKCDSDCAIAIESEDCGSVLEVYPHPKRSSRRKRIAI